MSWSPPTPLRDTTGYRIYYSGGSSGSEDVSGSSSNGVLGDLVEGGSYSVSLVAISQHLPSAPLTQSLQLVLGIHVASYHNSLRCILHGVYCDIICYAVPESPVLSVVEATGTSISISWTIPSGSVVDSHVVMWDSGSVVDSAMLSGSATSYTITGLEEGGSYSITVTAVNVAGRTDSNTLSATTPTAEGVCVHMDSFLHTLTAPTSITIVCELILFLLQLRRPVL